MLKKMTDEDFKNLIHNLCDSPYDLYYMSIGYMDGVKDFKSRNIEKQSKKTTDINKPKSIFLQ